MKILVTGSAGFIAGYLVQQLLDAGHEVVGVDNHSKYGRVEKSYDANSKYRFVPGDAKDAARMRPVSSTALRADGSSDWNFMRRSLALNVEISQRSPF